MIKYAAKFACDHACYTEGGPSPPFQNVVRFFTEIKKKTFRPFKACSVKKQLNCLQ